MDIAERVVEQVVIVDLNGRLTVGDASDRLKDKINSLTHEGPRRIALNMNGVTYIDSGGLGQLAAAFTTVKRQGGRLVLFNVGKPTYHLLAITNHQTGERLRDGRLRNGRRSRPRDGILDRRTVRGRKRHGASRITAPTPRSSISF